MRSADPTFSACFVKPHEPAPSADYTLLGKLRGAYAAVTRSGSSALVMPLPEVPHAAAGRRAAGCELICHPAIGVSDTKRTWDCPAAVLICHDAQLFEPFAVLADDVVRQVGDAITWGGIVAAVDEWLALLAPKGRVTPEREMGLWGELWFIARSRRPERTLAAWRGPDGDHVDFFVGGSSVEIKTSRNRYRHMISHDQLGTPVGDLAAWLLSVWVKPDGGDRTVPALVDAILSVASDRGSALKQVARAGYSPAERMAYTTSFTVLQQPTWFALDEIPRVRLADPGVSRLRYQVQLDAAGSVEPAQAERLWLHFNETPYQAMP